MGSKKEETPDITYHAPDGVFKKDFTSGEIDDLARQKAAAGQGDLKIVFTVASKEPDGSDSPGQS